MMFRSAMCPSCDNLMKLDSDAESVFCSHCGSRMSAEDAFVYYDLKNSGGAEPDRIEGYDMLYTCGKSFLEQKKHDSADSCFVKMLDIKPDDYTIWRLRAMNWESKVVFELKSLFYRYDTDRKELIENKDYLSTYKEYCDNAVRFSPSELAETLAEEFNDRIREHFSVALKAFNKEKRSRMLVQVAVIAAVFLVVVMMFQMCGTG